MGRQELLHYEGVAESKDIRDYQRKIGSLMYVAVRTRPDRAFAVSRLAQFMTNPGPEHHDAAVRVLKPRRYKVPRTAIRWRQWPTGS